MDTIKNRISSYWSQRAETFSAQRFREFESEKHALWLNEFKKYFPENQTLDILDVGTGSGFFALLLGGEHHRVVGIDLCEEMIAEARRCSEFLNIPAQFYAMDAENPDLRPESFDAIVTRNLTWTLPHLPEAYRNWHTLLKPGGILVNFDADYCREGKNQALPENHAHKNLAPSLMREYESIKDTLRAEQLPRPQWDIELLSQAGFHDIQVDCSVWKRIYHSFDEFYNPTPIFVITAQA